MAGMSIREQQDADTGLATETREPRLFNVVLFNDDATPMEFVIALLMKIFGHQHHAAELVMLQIHNEGMGVAGTYPFDIAEAKVSETKISARRSGFPLHCTTQPERSSKN